MITLEKKITTATAHLSKSKAKYIRGAMIGLRNAGQIVRDEIKRLITDPPKTGIKYRHLPNRSSALGEAPANQSGKLRKSVIYLVKNHTQLEVGDTVLYGKFLEFYHRRPHVSTAGESKRETVALAIQMSVNRELSK
jgi:hypothetical protein